jgi:two-component system CheB/CheR fusion protein
MDSEFSPRLARLVIENARDFAIFTLDDARTVTSWNIGAERLTGWVADEIVGQSADVFFTPEDRAAKQPELEVAKARLHGSADDVRWHMRSDGSRFWANGSLMVFKDEGGFVKILRDQTAQKLADDEQDALISELSRVNALQSELLGLISHEARTPLTAIIGTADVLIRGQGSIVESDQRIALEDIRRNGERLETLIANMLSLARTAATGDLELEPILLQRELPRLVEEHLARFPNREIRLNVPGDLPPVLGQPIYLGQVVRNLLDNVEKYADPAAVAEVNVARGEEVAVVRVLDRGAQISEDTIERLFTPFFRAEGDAKRAPGLGLGMAVCQRLVHAQGGEISATARPAGGLAIAFTLRLVDRLP